MPLPNIINTIAANHFRIAFRRNLHSCDKMSAMPHDKKPHRVEFRFPNKRPDSTSLHTHSSAAIERTSCTSERKAHAHTQKTIRPLRRKLSWPPPTKRIALLKPRLQAGPLLQVRKVGLRGLRRRRPRNESTAAPPNAGSLSAPYPPRKKRNKRRPLANSSGQCCSFGSSRILFRLTSPSTGEDAREG